MGEFSLCPSDHYIVIPPIHCVIYEGEREGRGREGGKVSLVQEFS